MKRLHIVRHAKSSWSHPELRDFERPLNKRGQRDAPLMGEVLRERGAAPDLMVTSPANRALTTARMIADAIGYEPGRLVTRREIYGAVVGDMIALIQSFDDAAGHAFVFGHNPTMTDLANTLCGSYIDNMPTCAAVEVEFDVASWSEVRPRVGREVEFLYPKQFYR